MMKTVISFPSQDSVLKGYLFVPDGGEQPLPVVIMAHGFSATINGMVADQYAQSFCEAGFAVLLYDHRTFGMSGGEPRYQINRWLQARGYRDAIDFVTTLPEIDPERIAIWGDSMSGGQVIILGAVDERVKAVVAQVPACGQVPPPPDPDGLLFESLRDTLLYGDLAALPADIDGPMPVVSHDQLGTPSLLEPITAFRWFIEYGGRYETQWSNAATLVTPQTPVPFHPGLCAPYLNVPVLMVVAYEDEMPGADTHIAHMVFDKVPEPKEMYQIEGGHFGLLYYPGERFDESRSAQCDFLRRCL